MSPKDIEKKKDKNFEDNMILTKSEQISKNMQISGMNRHVILLGRPGTGKSRYYFKPNILSETGSIIKKIEPNAEKRIIKEETSKLVRHALESVVANGSGKNAYIENYRVGGKTGTAQKVKDGKYMDGNYILSFMGFLPANDPEIIVYAAIDNPKGVTQYGGVVSAPIVKSVLNSAIDILDIKPSTEGMPREYTWIDKKYLILPNVVGMSKEEATKTLKSFKIEYSGTGEKVIYQSPASDYYVKEGETIKILLG